MATDDPDPFTGRTFGDLVFLTTHDRNFYIGELSPSQTDRLFIRRCRSGVAHVGASNHGG